MSWQKKKKKKTALLTAPVLHSASICLDCERVPAKVEHALIPSRTQSTGHSTSAPFRSEPAEPFDYTTTRRQSQTILFFSAPPMNRVFWRFCVPTAKQDSTTSIPISNFQARMHDSTSAASD